VAIVVEDGSGKTDAECYATLVETDAYHTAMGDTTWGAESEADREVAKRKAAQYLDLTYGGRWRGERANDTQALAWPRSSVEDDDGYAIDSDAIPQKLKDAEAVAAYLFLTTDILADIDDPAAVESYSVKVGPITETTKYVGGNPATTWYRRIDMLVSALVWPRGRIVRA
jgi:hypothetical protein